jgi:hypothetical protein
MRSAVPGGCGAPLSNDEALGVEAEAFWCFARLMDAMEGNFSSDSRWAGLLAGWLAVWLAHTVSCIVGYQLAAAASMHTLTLRWRPTGPPCSLHQLHCACCTCASTAMLQGHARSAAGAAVAGAAAGPAAVCAPGGTGLPQLLLLLPMGAHSLQAGGGCCLRACPAACSAADQPAGRLLGRPLIRFPTLTDRPSALLQFLFEEVLRLWEALWAGVPGMHLYLCVAVLEHHRRRILRQAFAAHSA